ncbi:unnamed protein product [Prorocentrum cordatum]|uniref:peptidylprolyl isomerase n=1 Tax=Prorocentrum cordatum TaxID=2364126 RepID=A0ABN9RNV0_9DINO|nr:unnamed protein product [Polarella glacialis]
MAPPGAAPPGACLRCRAAEAPFLCSRCRSARYCSAGCQRSAWPLHRKLCSGSAQPPPDSRGRGAAPEEPPAEPAASNRGGDAAAPAETPAACGDGCWVRLMHTDSFPGMDAATMPAADLALVQAECCRRGCGGFVVFRGTAYLRAQPPGRLCAEARHSQGATLWLPAAALASSSLDRLGEEAFRLPESLPEVLVPGARSVDKLRGVTETEMTARFASSRPVVLLDAQEAWPAREKWTFDWLAQHFGDEEMPCSDLAPFFKWCDRQAIRTAMVPIREFVRYAQGRPSALRGMQRSDEQVFYANGWAPFAEHPHLLEDVSDRLYCVQDRVPRGNGPAGEFNNSLTKVFFGPAGTVSRLHHDTFATHVWLSQIRGRKQFIVYPPEETPRTCTASRTRRWTAGPDQPLRPVRPGLRHVPEGPQRDALQDVVVEEGETVILPSRWFHWAKSLTPSITLMRTNFVNDTNVAEYVRIRQHSDECKGRARLTRCRAERPLSADPSAIRREVLRPGDGKTFPKDGDTVTVHYTGALASSGARFDSSVDRGKPLVFRLGVGKVIRGWDDGITQMSLGEKSKLHIRSDLRGRLRLR